MPAPSRPGAPRSSSQTSQRPAVRAPRQAAERTAPPSRQRRPIASGSIPTVRRAVDPAPVRGPLAAALSWKSLAMAGVLGLAFALVTPSVRAYLGQERELAALQAQRDSAKAEVDDLDAQVARWDDPAYVMAQARDRLIYVMPGETPYRVVDPEVAMPAAQGSIDAQRVGIDPGESKPWFERAWDEIETTGLGPSAAPKPGG